MNSSVSLSLCNGIQAPPITNCRYVMKTKKLMLPGLTSTTAHVRVPPICICKCLRLSIDQHTPAPPHVTSVPVRVAQELLQAGHQFLDVRTREEFNGGHVVGAINVPFMLACHPQQGMIKNPRFVEEVLNHFTKYDEIIVGCQVGKRSYMAASELISVGFCGVIDMAGGYVVWLQNGLPISTSS